MIRTIGEGWGGFEPVFDLYRGALNDAGIGVTSDPFRQAFYAGVLIAVNSIVAEMTSSHNHEEAFRNVRDALRAIISEIDLFEQKVLSGIA